MSGTVLSQRKLRRRPIHNDAQDNQKLPLRKAHHSPQKSSDEDTRDSSFDEDEVDDENMEVENMEVSKEGLYPSLSSLEYDEHTVRINAATGKRANHTEPANVPSSSKCSFRMMALCFVVLILCFGGYFAINNLHAFSSDEPFTRDHVAQIMGKLKEKFVNQPTRSFRIIEKALERVTAVQNEGQPSAPAILLLMSTKGAKNVTSSFAEQLAKLIAVGDYYQTIYGEQLQSVKPDVAKKEIDSLLIDTLENKKQKVVVIKDLDAIHGEAVMILHNYCDHENAKYKNAVFIMTIDSNEDLPNNSESKQFDKAAELHLTRAWSDLSKDNLESMLSRITVSVAAIKHVYH